MGDGFNIRAILDRIPEDHPDRETAMLAALLHETAKLRYEVERLVEACKEEEGHDMQEMQNSHT